MHVSYSQKCKKSNVAVEKQDKVFLYFYTNICLAEFNRNLERSGLDLTNKSHWRQVLSHDLKKRLVCINFLEPLNSKIIKINSHFTPLKGTLNLGILIISFLFRAVSSSIYAIFGSGQAQI